MSVHFYQAYVANAQGTIHVSVNILICTLQPVQQQVKICVSECTYMFWGDLTSLILPFFFDHEYKVLWVILLLQQYVHQSEE